MYSKLRWNEYLSHHPQQKGLFLCLPTVKILKPIQISLTFLWSIFEDNWNHGRSGSRKVVKKVELMLSLKNASLKGSKFMKRKNFALHENENEQIGYCLWASLAVYTHSMRHVGIQNFFIFVLRKIVLHVSLLNDELFCCLCWTTFRKKEGTGEEKAYWRHLSHSCTFMEWVYWAEKLIRTDGHHPWCDK